MISVPWDVKSDYFFSSFEDTGLDSRPNVLPSKTQKALNSSMQYVAAAAAISLLEKSLSSTLTGQHVCYKRKDYLTMGYIGYILMKNVASIYFY